MTNKSSSNFLFYFSIMIILIVFFFPFFWIISSSFKHKLSELLVEKIEPIGKKIKDFMKNTDYIDSILKDGSLKANNLASKKMREIKKLVGF